MDTVRINEKDNVCVNLETGHKIAVCDIPQGADIIKYGFPIGYATENISKGDSVHSHNMKTKLGDILSKIKGAGKVRVMITFDHLIRNSLEQCLHLKVCDAMRFDKITTTVTATAGMSKVNKYSIYSSPLQNLHFHRAHCIIFLRQSKPT